MSSFTVRVELDSNIYSDFEILHKAMELGGFKKTITSDDSVEYHLPRAEYNISTSASRSAVLKLAENAAAKTYKKAEILVTESSGRSWSGLNKVR